MAEPIIPLGWISGVRSIIEFMKSRRYLTSVIVYYLSRVDDKPFKPMVIQFTDEYIYAIRSMRAVSGVMS